MTDLARVVQYAATAKYCLANYSC